MEKQGRKVKLYRCGDPKGMYECKEYNCTSCEHAIVTEHVIQESDKTFVPIEPPVKVDKGNFEYVFEKWENRRWRELIQELEDIINICNYACNADGRIKKNEEVKIYATMAMKKQSPMKPATTRCDEYVRYSCPVCGRIFETHYKDCVQGHIPDYCGQCGQRLDKGTRND